MANFCSNCAQPVQPTMKACPQCGTMLISTGVNPASAQGPNPVAAIFQIIAIVGLGWVILSIVCGS